MEDLRTLETKLNALIAKCEMIEAVDQFSLTTASTRRAISLRVLVVRRARRNTSLTFSRR